MKKSTEYLKEALEKMGNMSDAKKAERLKISRQALSSYQIGNRIMDDFMCILVARELGIDPLEVIAAANMEREKSQERRDFWQDFREKIGITGLAGLLVLTTMTPQPAHAINKSLLMTGAVHYVNYLVRVLRKARQYLHGYRSQIA